MSYALAWLADVLRAGGCKVDDTSVADWKTRGHADFGIAKGLLLHHTAGQRTGNMPSLATLIHGRSDLAGPLCNLGLGRDGTFYCVAAGKAWHAGFGSWQSIPMGNFGNSELIGIEMENTGAPDDYWPPVQLQAAHAGVVAILRHIGAQPIMCAGHKEYARNSNPPHALGRKVDPSMPMPEFRLSLAPYFK